MRRKRTNLTFILVVSFLLCAFTLCEPNFVKAQGYGFGGPGYGMGGPGYGMGGYGYQGGGFDQGGPGLVWVKYGEKIYDAVFGDLIDFKVYYIQVRPDSVGSDYYDDGTHGDEVAYDGMPSLIYINKDEYIGPFTIKYKHQKEEILWESFKIFEKTKQLHFPAYESIIQSNDKRNILEKMRMYLKSHPREMEETISVLGFYDANVASDDSESQVSRYTTLVRQFESEIVDSILTELIDVFGVTDYDVLSHQFVGQYDDETYEKNIDPQLFESLEGFGGGFGGGFDAAGYLPDLPPPPGIPRPENLNADQQGAPGEPSQSYNPIDRAQNAANQASGGSAFDPTGSLQATEAMNELP